VSKIDQILQILSVSTVILSSSLTPAIASKPSEQINQYTNANLVILEPNNLQAEKSKIIPSSTLNLYSSSLLRTSPKKDLGKIELFSPQNWGAGGAKISSQIADKQLQNTYFYSERDIYALIAQNNPETPVLEPEAQPEPILEPDVQPESELETSPETESETNQESGTSNASDLAPLNPNPDKLAIPKTPEEVTIDINQPITLEQAIQLGLRNNRDLQEAELNLERSRKQLREARAALFPTLVLQNEFTNSDDASNELSNEIDNEQRRQQNLPLEESESTTGFTGNLNLQYGIYTGGRRGADIRRAKRQVEVNQLDVERVTEQTIFEAKRDYYSLQDADSQVETEQGAVEDANQTLKDAQLLEQAGLGTQFDVLRAEVELANAQQRLTSAKATQQNARRQLVETLSVGEKVELTTADEIAKAGIWELALENSIITAYSNRAELKQFLLNREISQEQRKIELSEIRPQLSIFGEFDFLEVSDDDIDITTGYTVGATLQWAIFDGGVAKARARQADVDTALADNGFVNQKNQVRLEVEQAFFSLQANDDNITTSEKAVELAEESLRLARLRFQAGVGTQTDVIAAQTELTTARGNFFRAVTDYNQSLSQLQRAVTNIPDPQIDNQENIDNPDNPNNTDNPDNPNNPNNPDNPN
jgi:outer membrane protein TolC